jgi:hypothetical protein
VCCPSSLWLFSIPLSSGLCCNFGSTMLRSATLQRCRSTQPRVGTECPCVAAGSYST